MKRFCFVMIGILLSCVILTSCAKDSVSIPNQISKMIKERSYQDNQCMDCRVLYRVDEYFYNGDRVFMFIFSSDGWSNFGHAVLCIGEGFSIGSCYFNDEYPLDNPYRVEGCYDDFIKNGQFVRAVWSK